MSHALKVLLFFFASTLVTVGLGLGASFTAGHLWLGLLLTLFVSVGAIAAGALLCLGFGIFFRLASIGRILQYFSFWFAGVWALVAAGSLFKTVMVVSNAPLASFVALAVCFISATLCGQIPWHGEPWLPVWRKNKK